MKRAWAKVGVVLAHLVASAAYAGNCIEPAPFTDIPSGAHATREQMLAAQRGLKSYDVAVRAYTDCLQQSGDTSNKANQTVDKLHQLADRFNEELQAFKKANGAT
jgi:hypothetical protein